MRMARRLLGALALTFLCSCTASDAPPGSDQAGAVFYQGARLVLGDGGVIESGGMLVEGTHIVAVGELASMSVSAGTRTVDLTGKTVIPALIDAHAHLGYEGYTSWGAEHYTREHLIENLERYAYYGFGAVFSAGSDPDDFALELQRAQQAGDVGGARFVFAAGMAPPGQGPNNAFLEHTKAVSERMGMTIVRGVASPADAQAAVAEVAAKGIPFIKIWVDDRGGTQQKLSPELYRAIISEARARSIRVVVHQQSTDDMIWCRTSGWVSSGAKRSPTIRSFGKRFAPTSSPDSARRSMSAHRRAAAAEANRRSATRSLGCSRPTWTSCWARTRARCPTTSTDTRATASSRSSCGWG
jgi:hypothetical protein